MAVDLREKVREVPDFPRPGVGNDQEEAKSLSDGTKKNKQSATTILRRIRFALKGR